MKRLCLKGLLELYMLSADVLSAEDQVWKANPPSQAEQVAPAQPAPAVREGMVLVPRQALLTGWV